MKITKEFTIDLAHRLSNHPGKCINVHGHTYKIQVTIEWDINQESGMVMDFGEFKKVKDRCNEYRDHRYLYKEWDLVGEYLSEKWFNTYEFSHQPTAEHMAEYLKDIVAKLYKIKDENITIRIYETPTSYAQA